MAMTTGTVGRPRNPDLDIAIILAAIDEIMEFGYAAASMSGIARRASVPKSTVYRRWNSKQELAIDAVAHLRSGRTVTHTGDTRHDLRNEMANLVTAWQDERIAGMTLNLATEIARNPAFHAAWEQRIISPFRERVARIIAEGIRTNQLRPGVDTQLIAELTLALPLHIMSRRDHGDISDLPDRFIDTLFEGLAAPH